MNVRYFLKKYHNQLFNVWVLIWGLLSINLVIGSVFYVLKSCLIFYHLPFTYSFSEKIRQSVLQEHFLIMQASTAKDKFFFFLFLTLIIIFAIVKYYFIKNSIKNISKFFHYIIKTGVFTSFIIITTITLFFLFSFLMINQQKPAIVTSMESNVTEFSLEKYNTCAVQKGALKCWGDIPSILSDELNLVSNVELVSAHGINTCISEKTIFKCLGFNMYGQLGVGTKEPVLKFQKINGLEQEVKQFKISYRHSCAIQRGALKCWGDNKYGQLGTSLWKIKELQKL